MLLVGAGHLKKKVTKGYVEKRLLKNGRCRFGQALPADFPAGQTGIRDRGSPSFVRRDSTPAGSPYEGTGVKQKSFFRFHLFARRFFHRVPKQFRHALPGLFLPFPAVFEKIAFPIRAPLVSLHWQYRKCFVPRSGLGGRDPHRDFLLNKAGRIEFLRRSLQCSSPTFEIQWRPANQDDTGNRSRYKEYDPG